MALAWPSKDPDEVLDYLMDWTERLDGDTIDTSVWTVPTGIVMDSSSRTTSISTIWLSGGTLGEEYEILNRITTIGGRTMDQTVKLKIKAR